MPSYRNALPQLDGAFFLTDAGLETDLIFNHGLELREFAAHTVMSDPASRAVVHAYFEAFLELARTHGVGFILDSQTWRAHPAWASALGTTEAELRAANEQSVEFISALRADFADNKAPIVLNAVVGPMGDAYQANEHIDAARAERYHRIQLGWLARTEIDMVSALTMTSTDEAIGLARAAREVGLPVVISFTVETDGRLPSGVLLRDAIQAVDASTDLGPAYYMVNCAHPEHFEHVLEDADWCRRIRGLRCNASRKSHAELDACETLDAGDPHELGYQYRALRERMPWLNVFGGCCGTDVRHVRAIADACYTAQLDGLRAAG